MSKRTIATSACREDVRFGLRRPITYEQSRYARALGAARILRNLPTDANPRKGEEEVRWRPLRTSDRPRVSSELRRAAHDVAQRRGLERARRHRFALPKGCDVRRE